MDSKQLIACIVLSAAVCAAGCGTVKQNEATQQLLASTAIDRSVAAINFRPLAGQKVFFDTKYLTNYKGIGFVNAEYVISSLRQQLFAAGCLVQDKLEDAEYVVEARVGTLGNDEHEIVYGMPANNALNTASVVVPNAPPLPAIPELSVARKHHQRAAAKVAAFAYHRETHEAVWQSGLMVSSANERDTWIMGAGPFESGALHERTEFAGARLFPWGRQRVVPKTGPIAEYSQEMLFNRPLTAQEQERRQNLAAEQAAAQVQQVSAEAAAAATPAAAAENSAEKPQAAAASPAAAESAAPAAAETPAGAPRPFPGN
jgi:hypothetical protein